MTFSHSLKTTNGVSIKQIVFRNICSVGYMLGSSTVWQILAALEDVLARRDGYWLWYSVG